MQGFVTKIRRDKFTAACLLHLHILRHAVYPFAELFLALQVLFVVEVEKLRRRTVEDKIKLRRFFLWQVINNAKRL